MINKRFKDTESIVGQFLPRVYTRRITLEDTKTYSRDSRWIPEMDGYSRRGSVTPGTAISVDYHIKDILSENGLGIITKSGDYMAGTRGGAAQSQEESRQDDILAALKIGKILCSTEHSFREMYKFLIALNGPGLKSKRISIEMPNGPSDQFPDGRFNFWPGHVPFETGLNIPINLINGQAGTEVIKKVVTTARPRSLGLELKNSEFEQYDINNNLVNIIPYSHTFKVLNEEFDNCENLGLICFTYFDFRELGIETISSTDTTEMGYMIGDITADIISRSGQVSSTAVVYKDANTNQPYAGPTHTMEDGTIMSGLIHTSSSKQLRKTIVNLSKIQDFRGIERSKMVNYEPATIEQNNNVVAEDSVLIDNYISKRNKNFFGIYDATVDLDRQTGEVDIGFQLDLIDIYKNNSRYYNIVKNLNSKISYDRRGNAEQNQHTYGSYDGLADWCDGMMKVQTVQILRKRVSKRRTGFNKTGGSKRVPYNESTEPVHVVATLSQFDNESDSDVGFIRRGYGRNLQTYSTRTFTIKDKQIAKLRDTGGVYEYGIRMLIHDNTKQFFQGELRRNRELLNSLKAYLEEASIPLLDSHYVSEDSETSPIGLGQNTKLIKANVRHGNYNRRTNTFTTEFKEKVMRVVPDPVNVGFSYSVFNNVISPAVDGYIDLVKLTFSKTTFAHTSANESLQTNDDLVTPSGGRSRSARSPLDTMMQSQEYSHTQVRPKYINMLRPQNATLESIQNFIKAYEEVIMTLENFFDFQYYDEGMNTVSGAGFSARGQGCFEVQRWLPENRYNRLRRYNQGVSSYEIFADDNTYVDLSYEEVLAGVHFDYPIADLSLPNVARQTNTEEIEAFLEYNQSTYNIQDSSPMIVPPSSMIIGFSTLEVFFNRRMMEKRYPNNKNPERPVHQIGFDRSRATPVLCENEKHIKIIDNFVITLAKYQKKHGAAAGVAMLKALDLKIRAIRGGRGDETFKIIENITYEMRDSGFMSLTNRNNSSRPTGEEPQPLTSPASEDDLEFSNECGLYDNRPTGNTIVSDLTTFERDQGLDSFYQDVIEFYEGPDYVPPEAIIRQIIPAFEDPFISRSLVLASGLRSMIYIPPTGEKSKLLDAKGLRDVRAGSIKLAPALETIRGIALQREPSYAMRAASSVQTINTPVADLAASSSEIFKAAAQDLKITTSIGARRETNPLPLAIPSFTNNIRINPGTTRTPTEIAGSNLPPSGGTPLSSPTRAPAMTNNNMTRNSMTRNNMAANMSRLGMNRRGGGY